MDKKIYMEIYEDGELKNTFNDEKWLIIRLMCDLYRKQFLKEKCTLKCNYNYSDIQIIEIIRKYHYDRTITTTKDVYYNIPTKRGYLDIDELYKKIGGEY